MPVKRFFIVSWAFFFLWNTPAWAVIHVHPGTYPNAAHDQIHHPSAQEIAHYGVLGAKAIGAKGTKNVAVLIVQFSAGVAGLTSGSRTIQNYNNIDSYFNNMAAFYNEESYGQLTL